MFNETHISSNNDSVSYLGVQIILLLMNTMNIILHTTGSSLLITLYKNGKDSVRHLLIINLSLIEAIMSFVGVMITVSEMIFHENGAWSNTFDKYVSILRNTGLIFLYITSMYFITVDRLLEIHLNIKYSLYCNDMNSKLLLISTWIVGIAITITVIILTLLTEFEYEKPLYFYFFSPLTVGFVVLAIAVYISIFRKFRASRRRKPSGDNKNIKAESIWTVFKKSKFFIPTLLIGTFIVFVTVPGSVYNYVVFILKRQRYVVGAILLISHSVSLAVDAITYVFLQNDVRRLLRRWMGKKRAFPPRHVSSISNEETAGSSNIAKNCKITEITQ